MFDSVLMNMLYRQSSRTEVQQLLATYDDQTLGQFMMEFSQTYSKIKRMSENDIGNVETVFEVIFGRGIIKNQKQLIEVLEQDQRVVTWIAIIKALSRCQTAIQLDRVRVLFVKRIKISSKMWSYDGIQRYYAFVLTKDRQFQEKLSRAQYDKELYQMEYIQSFIVSNSRYLPPGFDFREVILRYVCQNRGETPFEKTLLNNSIQRLQSISLRGLAAMRFCFDFFRYPSDDKTATYLPQKSLFQVIRRYTIEELNKEIDTTFIGMIWTDQNYRNSIKNLIKVGITSSSVQIISKIKDNAIRSGKLEPMVQVAQADIMTAFIYLKFENLFKHSMELVREFLLGSPARPKCLEKIIIKLRNIMTGVPNKFRAQVLDFIEALMVKYENICPLDEITKLQKQFQQLTPDYVSKSKKDLEMLIEKYDWLCYEAKQAQKLADSKSSFRGLCNIGNSCYMNSFFQALFMTKEFRLQVLNCDIALKEKQMFDRIDSKDIDLKRKELRIIKQKTVPLQQLQKLFALLYKSKRPYISPTFIKNILPIQFRNVFQHDAGEFGRIFLSSIEQSTHIGFEGQSEIIIKCLECGADRSRLEKFMDFMLPPCNDSDVENVQAMLKKHDEPEILDKLHCEKCGKNVDRSQKRVRVKRLPDYLIVTLSRFTYSTELQKKLKLSYKVQISQNFQVEQYQEGVSRNVIYDLSSIIVHRGTTAESGHYFTFCKSDNNWVCFDDANITQLDNLQGVSQLIASAANDTPYIFFYEKRQHIQKITQNKVFSTPCILSQKLVSFIEKHDFEFVKEYKKPKFTLPKVPFSALYRKDDDEDEYGKGGGSNNRLIM